MRLLVDTHLLIWAGLEPDRLSMTAKSYLSEASHELFFSVASIWEVAIKHGLGRQGFRGDPEELRIQLLAGSYTEVDIRSVHAFELARLPAIHGDPFDRIMIAQAMVEGLTLLTADGMVGKYPGPILLV